MKMKLSVALVPNVNFQVSAGVLINTYRLCLWWRCPGENMCGLWSWILDFGTWRAAWEVVWKYPCILGWNLRWFGDTKNDLVNIQKNSIPDHVNPLDFYKGEIGVCQPDLITMYITGTQTHYWAVLPGLQLLAECKLSMRWSLICSRRWPKEKWLGPISKLDWTLLSLSLSFMLGLWTQITISYISIHAWKMATHMWTCNTLPHHYFNHAAPWGYMHIRCGDGVEDLQDGACLSPDAWLCCGCADGVEIFEMEGWPT